MSTKPDTSEVAAVQELTAALSAAAHNAKPANVTAVRPKLVKPIAIAAAAPAAAAAPVAPQADPISHYIELEMEARQCADLDALRFAIANSTRRIAQFEQAFLVEPAPAGGWSITRASSVATVDRDAPLVRALSAWIAHPHQTEALARGEPRQANLRTEAVQFGLEPDAFALPYVLWLPVKARDGRILAALLALKSENWRPHNIALMLPLAGAYGHAWEALLPRSAAGITRAAGLLSRKRLSVCVLALTALAAFVPVPMSVLAPAEVVAAAPVLVTAPIDGVVGDILAPPGAWVESDVPIVKLVDVKLRNEYEVAARSVAVAEARHFKIVQSATATQKDMQDLATTKAELDVAKAELDYAAEALARTDIRAHASGLLIYSAKSDWLGKPVVTGERIMEIGNPEETEIRIELPVSDAIVLSSGSKVSLFLDGDPLRSIPGTLTRTSYRPSSTADQQLVFRVYASFDNDQQHRIGLRGVARVSGDDCPLWFYLLRRPMAAVRQRIGL